MKIAICVPSRDTVHAGFALCLANLTARLSSDNIEFDILINLGSVIANQRNMLVTQATEKNATHILFLDSDMHFPATVVNRFLATNKKIIAANYSTRIKPQKSVAFTDPNNLNARLNKSTGIHEVFAVGLGCMLIDITVFDSIPKPWFNYAWNEDTEDLSGEDIYFCKQLNDFGFDVCVDCDTSSLVAHYGTKAFIISETDEFNR